MQPTAIPLAWGLPFTGLLASMAVCPIVAPRFWHWQLGASCDPLPTAAEALAEPFRAFPSWFLRVICDRCGKVAVLNEAHTSGRRRDMPLRDLLARMRHDGCSGIADKAELLTGIESASSRPVRRIILL